MESGVWGGVRLVDKSPCSHSRKCILILLGPLTSSALQAQLEPISPGTASIKPVHKCLLFLISCGTACLHSWSTSAFWPLHVLFLIISYMHVLTFQLYCKCLQTSIPWCIALFISSRASYWKLTHIYGQQTCFEWNYFPRLWRDYYGPLREIQQWIREYPS